MLSHKAWVITVDMGYGHQRAAYPLKDIAYERIITANADKIITPKEKKMWMRSQRSYEWISRMRYFPLVGKFLYGSYDRFQKILPYYPFRDLSRPNAATLFVYNWIRKGLCKSLIQYVKKKDIPLVTTFFVPALAADQYGLKKIYCVVTDSDINRVWVGKNPKSSNINYLAPSDHTVKRLKQYGVPDKHIFKTGFPLPKENLGGIKLEILKRDLGVRLPNLDPHRKYIIEYKDFIKKNIDQKNFKEKSNHPLTITFVVGGAGAQKEIGAALLTSFKKKITKNEVTINIVTGTRLEVAQFFRNKLIELGLENRLDKNVKIIFAIYKKEYFERFNLCLHATDILWTKPSELSFYVALGIPIIIAPPLGAHEEFNKTWLEHRGGGFAQENPLYANEWISDWIEKGRLAEAAMDGFLKAPKQGTYNIEKIIFKR